MKSLTSGKKAAKPEATKGLDLRRVLVVEDDSLLAMATEDTLREAGVQEVFVCTTTEGALEILREKQPDALILDVHLADRDDGWAIAELVETLGEHSLRIVFSTGSPEDIPPHIAELGNVLTKPYLSEDLLTALREPDRRGILARLRGALTKP